MITLKKAVEKRCTALKYMQQNVDWGAREITTKFGISSSFIALATKKGIIKKDGHKYRWNSTVDANARMATALIEEERKLQKEYKKIREEKKEARNIYSRKPEPTDIQATNTTDSEKLPIAVTSSNTKTPRTMSLTIIGDEVVMGFDDFISLIKR